MDVIRRNLNNGGVRTVEVQLYGMMACSPAPVALIDERNAMRPAHVVAHRVHERDAVVAEIAVDDVHEVPMILPPDVFAHANRNDGVVAAGDVAVVLQADLDGQLERIGFCLPPLLLFSGDGHAEHLTPVPLRSVDREAAPPASEIEHLHPWREADLAAHQIELRFLRLIQSPRVLPVGARVDHALVEHDLVQIVAEVVVRSGDVVGARAALHVRQERAHGQPPPPPGAGDLLLKVGAKDLLDEHVERLTVPPAIYVRLAEADRRVAQQQAAVESPVVDDDVAGRAATDRDPGYPEELANEVLRPIRFRRGPHETPRSP